jgi:hypothetical protein
MRSEQSDEQSAEQLQEVKHPRARIAHRGVCAIPDTIFGSHSHRLGSSPPPQPVMHSYFGLPMQFLSGVDTRPRPPHKSAICGSNGSRGGRRPDVRPHRRPGNIGVQYPAHSRLPIPTTSASNASCAPRLGRNPYENPRKSSS